MAFLVVRLYRHVFKPITLGVRLILVKDEQILLVQHTYMDKHNWYFPGGSLKKGETAEQAARREAYEEVGLHLGELKLLGVFTSFTEKNSDHIVVFACNDYTQITTQNNRFLNHEIAMSRCFPIHQLPPNLAAGHKERLHEYLHDHASPGFGNW